VTARAFTAGLMLIAFTSVAGSAAADDKRIKKRTLQSDGKERTYSLYVPPGPADKRPLLIALHGSGGRGKDIIPLWLDTAERENFVIAAPDSLKTQSWQVPVDGPNLLRDVVDDLDDLGIDKRRIYLFGYSAGAVFALYVGPLESEYFAAVAVHAGAYNGEADLGFLDDAERKIPIFISVGTADGFFPLQLVNDTQKTLQQRGFPLVLKLLSGRAHNFNRPFEVIGPAWRFLSDHRLDDDPFYNEVQVGRAPNRP
jgi:poly(3-hydroxybutyrate) depolymerase